MPRLPVAFPSRFTSLWTLAFTFALSLPATAQADEVDFDAVMAAQMAVWADTGVNAALLEQVAQGADVFATTCAVCHGDLGEGGSGYAHPIVNTRGLDKFRTAQRLFLYNRDLMPFNDPGSMQPEEAWQVTAWLVAMNGWFNDIDGPLAAENARRVMIKD